MSAATPPADTALIDFAQPLHGTEPRLRAAFAAPRQVLVAQQMDQVRALLNAVETAAQCGHWCVGYLCYEAAPAFDTALQTHAADGPLAWFAVYDAPQQVLDEAMRDAGTASPPQLHWTSTLQRDDFDAALRRIASAIAAGAYYQANFTAPLTAELVQQGADENIARALFAHLQAAQPGGYAAMVPAHGSWVLSVSPELFFDWDSVSRSILARPMKGTAARGDTPEADAAAARALQTSPKERAENVMVVDLLRNDLSRIAEAGSVQVPRLFHTEALPTVWQMTSDVRATTRSGIGLVDVFAALFPCGSITGAPKAAAMQALTALETQPRGVYCGALGVVRPAEHGGNGGIRATFNVPIRTVELRGNRARCGIGSGITSGSVPDAEWLEWQAKRAFLERASAPFELLETLALRDGSFQNLERHVKRMAESAAHFRFACDVRTLRAELQAIALQRATGHWRVRLLLAAKGSVRAEAFALTATASPVNLQLAQRPMAEAHGAFVRHKTTRRAHYEAFAPQHAAVFDTILYNQAGEITECTRGNIAALVDGRWITPPLHCGLLPGVGRARALDEARLQEAVLRLKDVGQVSAWAFVNSLRGWLDARLVP